MTCYLAIRWQHFKLTIYSLLFVFSESDVDEHITNHTLLWTNAFQVLDFYFWNSLDLQFQIDARWPRKRLDISHIRSAICSLYQFDFMSNDASGSSLHPVDILRSSLKYSFKTWGLWSCVVALHILLYNLSQSTLQTCSPNVDILKLSVEGVQWYYHTKVSWWHWILDNEVGI